MSLIDEALIQRVLRCVPDADSGETVTPDEVRQRLGDGRSVGTFGRWWARNLVAPGRVIAVRKGCYRLPEATP